MPCLRGKLPGGSLKMSSLTIEGLIVNRDESFYGQVSISKETGLITRVSKSLESPDLKTNGLIFPGFGDLHVHAREDASHKQDYKEDFSSASAAAVNGGVVHYCYMPNNPVAPIDEQKYREKQALAAKSSVHVTLYAGIGPSTNPLPFRVPYKAYMGPSVGDLFFTSQEQLEETIKRYRGQSVSFHCEDPRLLEESKSRETHEQRRPAEAEVSATEFALHLVEEYGLQGKLCHFSTRDGLRIVEKAKKKGLSVTCEVTPHHLFFDDSMLSQENRLWLQMNPPIRSKDDRLELIEALRRGVIDFLATDHAPHTAEEKMKGTSGVPHLDTYGAFVSWLLVEQKFKPEDVARVCSFNPGEFVKPFLPQALGKGFGRIEAGFAGSLAILNPDSPRKVTR